jgi:hypothetical protein
MCGADLHVFVLGIIDFVLNSALQGSVVARAGRQMQDEEEPRSDEQSKEENSHSVFRIDSSVGRQRPPVSRPLKPNEGQWTHQCLSATRIGREPAKFRR